MKVLRQNLRSFALWVFHICVPNVYQIVRKITSLNLKIFFRWLVQKKHQKQQIQYSGWHCGQSYLFNGGSIWVKSQNTAIFVSLYILYNISMAIIKIQIY